jgi:amino-acid N-acetyltransferase
MIRKAIIADIKQIHKLLNYYGDKGFLLARPLSELYDHLRDFMVLVEKGEEERIIGACALGICWEDLADPWCEENICSHLCGGVFQKIGIQGG